MLKWRRLSRIGHTAEVRGVLEKQQRDTVYLGMRSGDSSKAKVLKTRKQGKGKRKEGAIVKVRR